VAKHYRVTQAAVSKLVVRVKRDPKLLSELLNKKEEEKSERQRLSDALLILEKDFGFLDSVEFCRKELELRGFEGLKYH
jgi:hypothetical protein